MIHHVSLVTLATFLLTTIQVAQSQPVQPNANFFSVPLSKKLSSLKAHHVMLRVPNFEETKKWYIEKLGFREEVRWTDPRLPGITSAYLERDGFRIEIIGGGSPRTATIPKKLEEHLQDQGYRHLCFLVDDVDATLAALNQQGVATLGVFNYPPLQRRLGFVLDNNGNVIEFSGPISKEN